MQNPDEDTEWNDILRSKGILPPKPKEDESESEEEDTRDLTKDGRAFEDLSKDDLDELEDDEDERVLEDYRRKRMAELKQMMQRSKFGHMIDITANEYKREVNEAGPGVWVIVFLYQSSILVCRRLQQILKQLAEKHPTVKFVQSVSTQCIPNYPDRNLPSIFIYHEDDLKAQFIGPSIFGGESMTEKGVEWALSKVGAFEVDMEEDPREESIRSALGSLRVGKQARDSDDDDDD